MKTNNKVDISNESLQDAAKDHSGLLLRPTQYNRDINYRIMAQRKAFISGANWQKEKDKDIQDKLIEALKENFDLIKGLAVVFYNEMHEKKQYAKPDKTIYEATLYIINNNASLLQSIKDQQQ